MIISSSTNTYSQMQTASDSTRKVVTSQSVSTSSPQAVSASSLQATISGQGLLMSRLFGNADVNPQVQTQLTKQTMKMDSVNFLTLDDRDMLSDLYAQAQQQGVDLHYVDDLAKDLGSYRMFGGVMANANSGEIYDSSGRKQTFQFSDNDAATADRILNSGNTSSSVLDPAFLNYELNPGYSFTHHADFSFLESIVNNAANDSGSGLTFDVKFSNYQSQGNQNYIINTDKEVTLQTEEADYGSIDGVFFVTQTGLNNGFRLEEGKVVQNSSSVNSGQSSPSELTLIDYMLNNDESDKSGLHTTLFDFLYAAKSEKNVQE